MSITQQVREALRGGKALSIGEIVKATGLSNAQVQWTLAELRRTGRAESWPTAYSLTARGESGERRRSGRRPGTRLATPADAANHENEVNKSETEVESSVRAARTGAVPNSVFALAEVGR